MKQIIIALSATVAAFAIVLILAAVGFLPGKPPAYQPFPVDVQIKRTLDDVEVSFDVKTEKTGYVYSYVIKNNGKANLAFSWDVLNRMEKSLIVIPLEPGDSCSFSFESPSVPVMCLGTATVYKNAVTNEFNYWKAVDKLDLVGPASMNSSGPPVDFKIIGKKND